MAVSQATSTDRPADLSVVHYAEARAEEVLSMAQSLARDDGKNSKPLQKLPRHMRRRAASHNVKRLPRRQHDWAKREMIKSGAPVKRKRPSRKHRRRPHNLLQEYIRRGRQHVWLETHLWHAKRFHMMEKWGYKIPFYANDKGARAAYRAIAKYCLLQDISYYCCIEIHGPQQYILAHLSELCSQDTGLTFNAKAYIQGNKEGCTMLYRRAQYPYGALGKVQFIWRCSNDVSNTDRQLWIWTHPAMYEEVLEELRRTFNLTKDDAQSSESPVKLKADLGNMEKDDLSKSLPASGKDRRTLLDKEAMAKLHSAKKHSKAKSIPDKEKLTPVIRNPCYSDGKVTVRSLKDTLCRFHLTGPLSNDILLDLLQVAEVSSYDDKEPSLADNNPELNPWWKNLFVAQPDYLLIHKQQKKFWKKVSTTASPGELTPNSILGLTVRDPRLSLPVKKSMVTYDQKSFSNNKIDEIGADLSWSPLWQQDIRDELKTSMMSVQEINFKRSECLMPGSDLYLGDSEARVPLLLIQNPGGRTLLADCRAPTPGFASGWDLIVPGGWGMAFLMSLVFRGARVAGLRDSHCLAIEHNIMPYPSNCPETSAGKHWEEETQTQLQHKHQRMPPAKRPSFAKLGQMDPYSYPWAQLINEWDSHYQEELGNTHTEKSLKTDQDFYVLRDRHVLKQLQLSSVASTSSKKLQKVTSKSDVAEARDISIPPLLSCLVAVQVNMVLRGKPQPFSSICLPLPEDVTHLSEETLYGGPLEPIHKKTDDVKCGGIITSSSRHIVGYVKEGNFSFATGCGSGLGFVAGSSLKELCAYSEERHKILALVRAIGSRQYRFAELSISLS